MSSIIVEGDFHVHAPRQILLEGVMSNVYTVLFPRRSVSTDSLPLDGTIYMASSGSSPITDGGLARIVGVVEAGVAPFRTTISINCNFGTITPISSEHLSRHLPQESADALPH